MNIEVIENKLESFVVAEVLLNRDTYLRKFENVYYLYSNDDVLFRMHVMKDSSLVFFVDYSYEEHKRFKKLISEFSYVKNRELAYKVVKKFSFQFCVSDQEIAEELLEMILRFERDEEDEYK